MVVAVSCSKDNVDATVSGSKDIVDATEQLVVVKTMWMPCQK